MKRNGDTFRAQYLRVQEPYLSIAGETECEATLELPENSKLWVNLVVDIYFRESPRHPERHIGWWM